MSAVISGRPGRSLGLLVRYWACNMTLVHDQNATWPGFNYTPDEQTALRTIARRVPSFEFTVWLGLVVVLVLLFITAAMLLGTSVLASASGTHSLDSVSANAFMVNFAVVLVASIAVGFPGSMLAGSALTGRLFRVGDADLPDSAERGHYVHKLSFQFARMAVLGTAVVVALDLWMPERVWLLTRCVLPVLGPAVSIATLFYFRHRPKA